MTKAEFKTRWESSDDGGVIVTGKQIFNYVCFKEI